MAYTEQQNSDLTEENPISEEIKDRLEILFDTIAIALIESDLVDTATVENNQKFIRNGQLQSGQGSGVLALFQKDIKANQEDLKSYDSDGAEILSLYVEEITDMDTLVVNVNEGIDYSVSINMVASGLPDNGYDITEFLVQDGTFSNVSQFIPLSQQQSNVDIEKAEEFLDTNIFELLPSGDTRQARIIRFFQELNALLPPTIEDEQWDGNDDGYYDTDTGTNSWTGSLQYRKDYSISYAQDNDDGNIDEEEAFIHRLKSTANDTNSSRTIEDIYNRIKPYLRDIWEEPPSLDDGRIKYRNESSGYLKFRNPNQGIIIRNTNEEFVEGLDPSNLTYLDTLDVDGNIVTNGTGFTITIWVRFLDKVSEGTLFNFGNPMRNDNPFGFKLETYVLNRDDPNPHGGVEHSTWGEFDTYSTVDFPPQEGDIYLPRYENSNTARYVRLVVNDNGILRDSHTGIGGGTKRGEIPIIGGGNTQDIALAQTTFIPEDFNEWYFICATFNPGIDEPNSYPDGTDDIPFPEGNTQANPPGIDLSHSTNYWLNHINPSDGIFTANSGYGNRCKVEIISRSDLLRARGFKVD